MIDKLLPDDGEDYTDALVVVALKWLSQPPQDKEDAADTISMLLLRTGRDDFFRTHRINLIRGSTSQLSLYNGRIDNYVVLFDMYVISFLVRKGIGCRTRPVAYDSILADMDSPYLAARQARRIELLWSDPHSLLELCCFAVRDNMNNPSKHQIHRLGLPKAIEGNVLFRSVAREFCERFCQ